jgi:hypothetical protein
VKAGLAGALVFVGLLVWIASHFGATKAGFMGAAVLFGGVQLTALFVFWRSRTVAVRAFCIYTIIFCLYAELMSLAASIPALR